MGCVTRRQNARHAASHCEHSKETCARAAHTRVLLAQVVDNWYPGAAKDSKGVLLVVTAGKEGAISGGDKFLGVSSCGYLFVCHCRTAFTSGLSRLYCCLLSCS